MSVILSAFHFPWALKESSLVRELRVCHVLISERDPDFLHNSPRTRLSFNLQGNYVYIMAGTECVQIRIQQMYSEKCQVAI